jgi:dihydroorotate dehydrogenase electron transfer subunit
MTDLDKSHRGTILLEDAEVISHEAFAGEQFVMRLQGPWLRAAGAPGQFAHLSVDPQRPMRRPDLDHAGLCRPGLAGLSLQVVGEGTELLAQRRPARP